MMNNSLKMATIIQRAVQNEATDDGNFGMDRRRKKTTVY